MTEDELRERMNGRAQRQVGPEGAHGNEPPASCRICGCLVLLVNAQAHIDWHERLKAGRETTR
jgi:hypothetical protein